MSLMDASYHSIFGTRGKNYSQRGRHDSSSSTSQFNSNYPCVQGSSVINYESMYSDSSLGKKSRPKRGKYRNYDRDALTKAVQAVQNGEMSVHRAGKKKGGYEDDATKTTFICVLVRFVCSMNNIYMRV
jgi:hypothetical protein